MDIKDLNRSQFFLLLMLTCLVSSTATAIVTVTLMDQSPNAGIDTTVGRVVERTIEKVIPGATTTIVRVIEKVPTIPNEGEMIAQAVNKVSPGLVVLKRKTADDKTFAFTGFVVGDNLIATGAKKIPADLKTVEIALGKAGLQADLISKDDNIGVAFFRLKSVDTELSKPITFSASEPILGQTVVGLSLSEDDNVNISTGIILDIMKASASSTEPVAAKLFKTNASSADNLGGPVVNIKGEIIGLAVAPGYAVSSANLKALVDRIK